MRGAILGLQLLNLRGQRARVHSNITAYRAAEMLESNHELGADDIRRGGAVHSINRIVIPRLAVDLTRFVRMQ